MPDEEINLLEVKDGLVVAPAGCGKTELILSSLKRHEGPKPILVLTHTNAGVGALRGRLSRLGVRASCYRVATIDGWAIRLISMFPLRSGHDPKIIIRERPDYVAVRDSTWRLIRAGHVNNFIAASYSRLLVDEHQDCSYRQHAIVYHLAKVLPTCIVGDPLQSIFGFDSRDELPDWNSIVASHFPVTRTLDTPWRWINADCVEFGRWLLDVRSRLLSKQPIDLASAPKSVKWIQLNGTRDDYPKQLAACRTNPPGGTGSVLILGNSRSPPSQRAFASQTPGAVTVKSVDLRDLTAFARDLDINADDALSRVVHFAESVMTNVGANDLLSRIAIMNRGTERKEPNAVERRALAFQNDRSHARITDLLVEINRDGGVRAHRPSVLQACYRALEMCPSKTLQEAVMQIREQNRFSGRAIPKRAVGSTLLLKGLEAEVAVILDADDLDARNLYVAMTRGSKRLVICSRNPILAPVW